MALTGTYLINRVAIILRDVVNIEWTRAELLGALNDAQRAIAALVPEATATRLVVATTAGIRQTIPADGLSLLDVICNTNTDGTVRGSVIEKADRRSFDQTNPQWTSATPAATAVNFMYNERDKTAFYLSPPASGAGFLEILYSQSPVDVAAEANILTVMDLYAPAMIDFMLHRAFSKLGPFHDPEKASGYLQTFAIYVTGDAEALGRLAGQIGERTAQHKQQQGSQGDN